MIIPCRSPFPLIHLSKHNHIVNILLFPLLFFLLLPPNGIHAVQPLFSSSSSSLLAPDPDLLIPLNLTDRHGCPIGHEFHVDHCRPCPSGHYRFLAPAHLPTHDRLRCPLALGLGDHFYKALKLEHSSPLSCLPCPAGTYFPRSGAMSVTQCRACAPGTTSGEGAAKCWKCPRGRTAWPGSGRCVACNAGYAVVPPCVPGVPFPRAPACVKCPRGMYSDKRNALTCSQCPEGTTTAIVGASNKEMCRPCGTTTLLHGVSFGCSCRNTTIASTSFGTAEERAGLVLLPKHALQLLPLITVPTSTDPALDALAEPRRAVSSYRPVGDAICTRCPPGSRALSEYATNSSECTPCPRGTHYEYLRGCMPCPSGMHSFGTGASACRFSLKGDCPTGTFTDRSNVCKACPPGYEKHNRQCRRCEPGYVSFGGSGQCVKCEKPMVARPNGQGPCVCGRGRYYRPSEVKEGRKKTCLKCPKGTWIGRRFHTERECVRTCERKVLGLTGTCGKCKVGYRRRRREEGGGCVKCERGLETVFGMERCGRFDLKCENDEMMFVSPGLLGYSWTCRKIRF